MEHQIDATIMALQIVRPPLQEFAQSLDDAQRARFNGPPPSADTVAGSCKPSTAAVKRLLTQLDQAVQPTDAQRPATAAVADAFDRAAREFDVNCRGAVPPTALGRLDATVARLDATWRAVQIIEVALAESSERFERRAEHPLQRPGNRQHAVMARRAPLRYPRHHARSRAICRRSVR